MSIFKTIVVSLMVLAMAMAGVGYVGALYMNSAEPPQFKEWTMTAKHDAELSHQRAFIHLTGDGCTSCHAQWAQVDKVALEKLAKERGVVLYEGTIKVGKDNRFLMNELKAHNLGGVPAYLTLDKDGKYKVLEPGTWTPPDILKAIKDL